MGLIPGIHPNMIVLAVPFLAALGLGIPVIVFIVAMGVTNSIVDFIPSILLGAPEGGNELSVLPGHRMLLEGHGYDAVKLTVIGGVGAVIFTSLLLPVLIFMLPPVYGSISPYIHLLLIGIAALMILTEPGFRKIAAAVIFLAAGFIGLSMASLPIDPVMVLFPIFSGFFGVSILILQLRRTSKIPRQKQGDVIVSGKTTNRSIVFGSIGGIVSGFLPGVGSSEISTLATVDKNDRSFLATLGALTMANIILSILSLWLISRPRSGVAVAVGQLFEIGFYEVLLIVAVSLVSVGIAAVATLIMAKKLIGAMQKVNYNFVAVIVIAVIVVLTLIFSGPIGILLLVTCTGIGISVNLYGIKRGNLMGVLMLPTILFYAGL
ncbi:tripartite tricarboxylate transporter permease [Candidatus Woesearchaeota archaeon]|nr:tripartite tricarboxylate transporter permease [Candidatus Woesearchaeota archaeon]